MVAWMVWRWEYFEVVSWGHLSVAMKVETWATTLGPWLVARKGNGTVAMSGTTLAVWRAGTLAFGWAEYWAAVSALGTVVGWDF